MTAVMRIKDLRVGLRANGIDVVRGISLDVAPGEALGLVGESGSGKTLTCRAALGVLPSGTWQSGGIVEFAGEPAAATDRRAWTRLRGSRVGAVFQEPGSYLNPSLPVGRQVAEVVRTKLRLSRRQARDRAVELLDAVGLHRPEHVYRQYPYELSGGMLQRVMIAIAVSCDPDLIVADEPTTALDATVQAEIIRLLRRLRHEKRLAILFVSHDLAVIAQICDRIVVCYAGEVVESGPTGQILAHPGHPYTRELITVSSRGPDNRELNVIAGQPPAPGTVIDGCWFAERCAFVTTRCRESPVPLRIVDGREVRCIRAEEIS